MRLGGVSGKTDCCIAALACAASLSSSGFWVGDVNVVTLAVIVSGNLRLDIE
jgi:hypothetical protein